MGEIGKKPNPIVSDHASRSHNIPPILTVDGIIIATLQHKSKQTAEGQTSHGRAPPNHVMMVLMTSQPIGVVPLAGMIAEVGFTPSRVQVLRTRVRKPP